MRWLVFAIAITAATPSRALADDGYYFSEAFGGAGYLGELSRYDGAPKFQFGFGVRRGAWAVEAFGSFMIPDLFFIDCYGEECAYAAKPQAGLGAGGVDLRRRFRLLYLQRWGKPGVYERPGVFATLHGGVRWYGATDALQGYGGPGIGAGAALEGDLWILGYFADVGIDLLTLRGPGETIHGSTPYVMFGAKVGWL